MDRERVAEIELWLLRLRNEPEKWTVKQALKAIADKIIAEEGKDIIDNKTPILPNKPTEEEKTELAKNAVKGKYYSPYKLVYDKNRKTIVGMDIHDLTKQPQQPKLPEKLEEISVGMKTMMTLSNPDIIRVWEKINEILDYLPQLVAYLKTKEEV